MKSVMLRVTIVIPWAKAVAAMNAPRSGARVGHRKRRAAPHYGRIDRQDSICEFRHNALTHPAAEPGPLIEAAPFNP